MTRRDLIRTEIVDDVLLFENPRNDFQRGIAFAATSLIDPVKETMRTRFFGGPGRNIVSPAMVETGAPDASRRDDGRRVAAFSRDIEIAAGAQTTIAIVFGQAADRTLALDAARAARSPTPKRSSPRRAPIGRDVLGTVHVTTNRPDFDRLVEHLAALSGDGLASVRPSSAPINAAARSASAISCRTCCR